MSHLFQVVELVSGDTVTREPENGLRYIVRRTDSGPEYGVLTSDGPEYFGGLGDHFDPELVGVYTIHPTVYLHIPSAMYWVHKGQILARVETPWVDDLRTVPWDEYVRSRYTSWYLDNHQHETVTGVVVEYYGAKNPYRMSGVVYSYDDLRVEYDPLVHLDRNGTPEAYSLKDTAMYADDMARIISEHEREYHEGFDAFNRWENLDEYIRFLRDDIRDAIHTYRKAPSPWLHRTISDMWADRGRLRDQRDAIASEYSNNAGFTDHMGAS